MSKFIGSGVAIVTPFKKDSSIDYDAFEKLIEFQIENKTDAIIVCGTTGEASTLSKKEHLEVVRFCVEKVNKRIPVIAGSGKNNTREAIEVSQECEKLGVDGLLVVTPYYNKATQKGLINYYSRIAESVELPIILYNVPPRTAVNIEPNTVLELSKIKNIVGIKEASGNISQIANVCSMCDEDFYVYSGNDDQIVPIMALGGKGVISVVANVVPRDTHNITELFLEGKIKESRELQFKMRDLISAMFIEVNPVPVKTAIGLMGYGDCVFREPLINIEDCNLEILKTSLKDYNLI
ncbi:MAG: 4-hydroxy-tetrahydrodipicolinate synthase [bacterium]